MLDITGNAALAQIQTRPVQSMPPRRDSVQPNSQNLMQGPSYWTPQQRRLNVPGATSNPSQKRDTLPYTAPPPATVTPAPGAPAPVRPAETPEN